MRIYLFFIALFAFSLPVFSQSVETIAIRKQQALPCAASVSGKTGGNILFSDLPLFRELRNEGSCDYEIQSYTFSFSINGNLKEIKCQTGIISQLLQHIMSSSSPGSIFVFEKIIAKDRSSGKIIALPPLKFKVIRG